MNFEKRAVLIVANQIGDSYLVLFKSSINSEGISPLVTSKWSLARVQAT
jgi:hypothetical protein